MRTDLKDLYIFALLVAVITAVICFSAWKVEKWLLDLLDRPRPKKSRRARKVEKKPTYSPTARPGGIVYPYREGGENK